MSFSYTLFALVQRLLHKENRQLCCVRFSLQLPLKSCLKGGSRLAGKCRLMRPCRPTFDKEDTIQQCRRGDLVMGIHALSTFISTYSHSRSRNKAQLHIVDKIPMTKAIYTRTELSAASCFCKAVFVLWNFHGLTPVSKSSSSSADVKLQTVSMSHHREQGLTLLVPE